MQNLQEFFPTQLPYSPAVLKHLPRVGWRIDYYAYNPTTGTKERVRLTLNELKKRFRTTAEFRTYAGQLACAINAKLFSGWSPFMISNNETSRNYELLKDVMEKYIKEKEREKLSASTIVNYKCFNKILLEWLTANKQGNIEIGLFTKTIAIKFMDYLFNERTFQAGVKKKTSKKKSEEPQEEGKHMSACRYNNYLKIGRAFFSWAMQKEYCTSNPFETIKKKRCEEKIRTLATQDHREIIRKYFMEKCPQFMIVCELVFNALIRPVEISRIKVGQVDLKNKVIHLDAGQTKTGYARDAVLSDELVQILADTLSRGYSNDLFLVGSKYLPGKTGLDPKYYRKTWARMREQTGIPKSIQLYSLRDTGLTELFDNGLDAKTVMKAADHHDLNITTKYIAKHKDEKLVEKVNKVAPKF